MLDTPVPDIQAVLVAPDPPSLAASEDDLAPKLLPNKNILTLPVHAPLIVLSCWRDGSPYEHAAVSVPVAEPTVSKV